MTLKLVKIPVHSEVESPALTHLLDLFGELEIETNKFVQHQLRQEEIKNSPHRLDFY